MQQQISVRIVFLLVVLAASTAVADELELVFDLPIIDTVDYHKPYVAIWTEGTADDETLLLWHFTEKEEGKWLPDIRRWWRKQGRYGPPLDAVTGATRGPGTYREVFSISADSPFTLLVEVVREDGGRSLRKQQIDFTSDKRSITLPADNEIGVITINLGSQ